MALQLISVQSRPNSVNIFPSGARSGDSVMRHHGVRLCACRLKITFDHGACVVTLGTRRPCIELTANRPAYFTSYRDSAQHPYRRFYKFALDSASFDPHMHEATVIVPVPAGVWLQTDSREVFAAVAIASLAGAVAIVLRNKMRREPLFAAHRQGPVGSVVLTVGGRSLALRVDSFRLEDGGGRLVPDLAEAAEPPWESGEWHDLAFVFTAWGGALVPEMDVHVMQGADAGGDALRFDDFIDDTKRLSNRIMGVLVGITQGKALRVAQGAPHARNGFASFRRLTHTFGAGAPIKRMVMLSSVLNFGFRGPRQAQRKAEPAPRV